MRGEEKKNNKKNKGQLLLWQGLAFPMFRLPFAKLKQKEKEKEGYGVRPLKKTVCVICL